MRKVSTERLVGIIRTLAKERDTVILAHNYQEGPIQEAADYVGDSLKLAQYATKARQSTILFCGVHFMAETAAILCPDKKVIVPDLEAGCTLADMVMPAQVRTWKKDHPRGVVVCYVNTSAAVKAECDYCCTSSNALKIIEAIPKEKEILFVPDFYLGSYVKAKTKRNITLWKGYCPSHATIDPERIDRLRAENPEAEFIMHPECGCLTKQMDLADKILSTDGMVSYAKESTADTFIVATDNALLYRLRRDNPKKKFIAASEYANCHHMQRNTLQKVFRSLVTGQFEVTVEPAVAARAYQCIERMMAISEGRQPDLSGRPAAQGFEMIQLYDDWILEAAGDLR
ncbi:MAG: quinolinate synthase NadA [Candidatus Omnitrophica bacterium]|nr:quinolinate synthase NadA [Candidatus Omnitrophota bacterium]